MSDLSTADLLATSQARVNLSSCSLWLLSLVMVTGSASPVTRAEPDPLPTLRRVITWQYCDLSLSSPVGGGAGVLPHWGGADLGYGEAELWVPAGDNHLVAELSEADTVMTPLHLHHRGVGAHWTGYLLENIQTWPRADLVNPSVSSLSCHQQTCSSARSVTMKASDISMDGGYSTLTWITVDVNI